MKQLAQKLYKSKDFRYYASILSGYFYCFFVKIHPFKKAMDVPLLPNQKPAFSFYPGT